MNSPKQEPLVSIIVPYYNAEKTLPMTLASIQAQTYKNWECLIIDDGSNVSPSAIVKKYSDPRFRLIIEGQNRGRGYVRQKGLQMAQGQYICMVDADDWIYPKKLEIQVDFLNHHPDVALVACSMAILNHQNELAGVRHFGEKIFNPLSAPSFLPIPHAPSMIRADVAQAAGYDVYLKIAEDLDFLLKILLKHKYATLKQVLYAYTEFASLDFKKVMASQAVATEILLRYQSQYPKEVAKLIRKISMKTLGHSVLFALGAYGHLIRLRTQKASAQEQEDFKRSIKIIEEFLVNP